MKILDRIALNRLIKIITDFILAILKLFAPKTPGTNNPDVKKPRFPIIHKLKDMFK